ncbi:MAG: Asp-tRNA(Asn)/Glu-tRNA(Gln) amidotransferase subunit GatA [Candidatus Peribacteraceae bacterium]|nr:Asp-tRNA(Asn)/Glu-tRNA(Gln) amidotransferase subunit GatA [Candidatus Peribacteraceae bacterium]
MGNISSLTIAQAHEKLRSKAISSVELVQSCIDRIEQVDSKINAIVHRNFEEALECAKEVDAAGKFDHPLAGIPYLAKDVFCEEGVKTTACSNVLREKDYVAPFDSTTTKRLKAVGAISLGKTNTDEFTQGASTESSCYGVTACPWDTERVAGGSSGGSAAAVAADECIFALGTDTGGSIRQPAGFCGCTGMRMTYGRTSRYGVMSMASSLDTIGGLTRNVEDYALLLSAIAGQDPLDATTSDREVPDYVSALKEGIKGMKIGLPKEYFIEGIDPQVEAAVRNAADVLKGLGAKITEISLPHTQYAIATYYIIVPSEVSSNMARYDGIRYGHTPLRQSSAGQAEEANDLIDYYFKARSAGFGDEVKRRIMIGTYALSAGYFDAYYRQAQRVRALIKHDFDEAFQKVDVILSPVSPTPAFKIGAHENDPLALYLEDIFTVSQPLAGVPALSIPCGFSKENLPIGLQLTGPQWGEDTLLKVGYAYEQATDWLTKKPAL